MLEETMSAPSTPPTDFDPVGVLAANLPFVNGPAFIRTRAVVCHLDGAFLHDALDLPTIPANVMSTLKRLLQQGVPLGIASELPPDALQTALGNNGLEEFFLESLRITTTHHSVKAPPPAPYLFRYLQAQMVRVYTALAHMPPRCFLGLTDRPEGVHALVQAGMNAVAYTGGAHVQAAGEPYIRAFFKAADDAASEMACLDGMKPSTPGRLAAVADDLSILPICLSRSAKA